MIRSSKFVIMTALLAVGLYYLKQYMNGPFCTSKARIDGKVVIVTGANTGVGKETVVDLVKRGGRVYLACRSLSRGKEAVDEIERTAGVSGQQMMVLHLDLASFKSIRNFVSEFKKRESKLDILINNAGILFAPYNLTEDGFETTFAVNHLGHFLLTHLLAGELLAASPSRVVTVSGLIYVIASMRFHDLNYVLHPDEYNSLYAYAQSKLANVLFSKELAWRLNGTGVTTYSLHPGVISTEITRSNPIIDYIFHFLAWPFLKDRASGAQTTVCCAVDERLRDETGKFYCDVAERETTHGEVTDNQAAKRLWDISIDMVRLDPNTIHPALQ